MSHARFPSVRSGGEPIRGQRLARGLLRLAGWRAVGAVPDDPRFVVVIAPHTSNWDFVVGALVGFATGLIQRHPHGFLMKDSLRRWPFGPVMRRLGGVPVARTRPEEVVRRILSEFGRHPRWFLALAPEGTRRRADYWRSGFYHIARAADVPVVPVALDYGRRLVRLGRPRRLTGRAEDDMAELRSFYAGVRGQRPDLASPVALAPMRVTSS